MTRLPTFLLAGMTAAILAFPAFAQGTTGGTAKGVQRAAPVDCSKARNPAPCEQRQAAMQACQGMSGAERRNCMREHRQGMRQGGPMAGAGPRAGAGPMGDCSSAPNPQMCEQRQKVNQACAGKTGRDYMDCAAGVLAPSAGS